MSDHDYTLTAAERRNAAAENVRRVAPQPATRPISEVLDRQFAVAADGSHVRIYHHVQFSTGQPIHGEFLSGPRTREWVIDGDTPIREAL